MKFTKKEKEEILDHLLIARHKAITVAESKPAKRKTVWTHTEEEKKEFKERAFWLENLIKKVEQL